MAVENFPVAAEQFVINQEPTIYDEQLFADITTITTALNAAPANSRIKIFLQREDLIIYINEMHLSEKSRANTDVVALYEKLLDAIERHQSVVAENSLGRFGKIARINACDMAGVHERCYVRSFQNFTDELLLGRVLLHRAHP